MLRLLWLPALLLVVGIAFLLGMSYGLGQSSDKFITSVVPVLSMLGAWISGLGALAAVVTTLWLANKQRREDVEHLKVSLNIGLMNPDEPWFISVDVVSDGRRPATVRGIAFTSPHAKHALHLTGFMSYGAQLPVQLSYGEKAGFMLSYGSEIELRRFVSEYCGGKAKGLKIAASTNLNSFEAPVSGNVLSLNT